MAAKPLTVIWNLSLLAITLFAMTEPLKPGYPTPRNCLRIGCTVNGLPTATC